MLMLMLPQITGKWRYLLTGMPLAVLFGLIVHAAGQLAALFGMWRRFCGTCTGITSEDGAFVLTVTFQDAKRLLHTVTFRTGEPQAEILHPGDTVAFAMRTALFISGGYESGTETEDVLLRSAYRRHLRRTLLKTLLTELFKCAAAFAVFRIAMHVCFP